MGKQPCTGKNCGTTTAQHSEECLAEYRAAAGITAGATERTESSMSDTKTNERQVRAREALYRAAIDCPHSIESDRVVLRYDPKQPGANALAQLADRLHAAVIARQDAPVLSFDDRLWCEFAAMEGNKEARAILAQQPAKSAVPAGEHQNFLIEEDFSCLLNFAKQCDDDEADGYTVDKEMMKRLAELGAVRSHGFGRYSVTSFGDWLIQTEFHQSPTVPLRTIGEWNRIHAERATNDTGASND